MPRAGDLRTGRVRKSERRGDGDCACTPPEAAGDGGDDRRLRVRATVDGDGLAVAKASALATGIAVAPAPVAALTVVAPAVPTVAMTAVSRFAPVSILIVWPAPKPATLATLMLVAPAAEAADRVVAACIRKSLQLLPVSAPSGKRPALVLVAPATDRRPEAARRAGRRHVAATLLRPEAAW